ncbi:MAG: fumarate hydratase C-terminal domain-containing protein [Oscillospiraceae bacterium]|nr:fumarate hydratase C-terminal domain-containing protein [Oscillospiraceae bacterium]MBQ7055053.1 fumarate hydratase C-terminal domain-containing protein [Oscillospiraceae bacterium]
MAEYHLKAPLSEEDVCKLKLGDIVYISGEAFTCRSRLQKYIFDEGNKLPFSTAERNVLIHNGPIVVKEDGKWRLVSFMPTSSIRFEKWGAKSVDEWNLRMIVGKTTMGEKTAKMMKKKKCVHVSPRSVSPNLWIDSIEVQDVHLYDELGRIEAAWFFKLNDIGPFIVDIDTEGNNYFDALDVEIAKRKEAAMAELGIEHDFEFTKLY